MLDRRHSPTARSICCAFFFLAALYLAKLYNYLLFHTAAELFSIIISLMIFIIYLNTSANIRTGFYTIAGFSFLVTGCLDFLHTLSFKGMNIFIGYDANLATSLWIAARYLESTGLLLGFLLIRRKLVKEVVLSAYLAVALIVIFLIFKGFFPTCYVEGTGLTSFKVVSEYLICAILAAVIWLGYRNRMLMDRDELRLVIGSCTITIAAELSFTLYVDPYGVFNMVGHFLKIAAYYLIYKAIIASGLHRPYLELMKNERALTALLEQKNILLKEVHHRVKNNLQNMIAIMQLQAYAAADPAIADHLGPVIGRVKSLGIVHEMMYQHTDVSRISFKGYLQALLDSLFQAFSDQRKTVAVDVSGDDLFLSLDAAVPAGLLANEILTNSLAHAFPGRRAGKIAISTGANPEGMKTITFSDDGIGLPQTGDDSSGKNLGRELIQSFVRQMNGSLELESAPGKGTSYTIVMGKE